MAVYTVLTKTLCEQAYLNQTGGKYPEGLQGKTIPEIVGVSAGILLPENFPVWQDATADSIKQAILRHYYMREIGAETYALWQFYLSTKLNEIMPWYVDLHNRLDKMADIFISQVGTDTETIQYGHVIQKSGTDTTTINDTTDDTGTIDRTNTDTGTIDRDGTDTGTVANSGTNDRSGQSLYSDTPQNGLSSVIQGQYLTNATVDSDTTNIDNTETRNLANSMKEERDLAQAFKEVRALQNTREVTNSLQHGMKDSHSGNDVKTLERTGFSGDKVDVLQRYRDLHLNIMREIIEAVGTCWLGVIG